MKSIVLKFSLFLAVILPISTEAKAQAELIDLEAGYVPVLPNESVRIDGVMTKAGTRLGRVLFYDTKLSPFETVSCASCHEQRHAFGDPLQTSLGGFGALTRRHSMRLVNVGVVNSSQPSVDIPRFWNERARSLEEQVLRPIRSEVEMGFSGSEGLHTMDDLIRRLQGTDYYPDLFKNAFGDPKIDEDKIASSLAQFLRSIVSFDSRYDSGELSIEEKRGENVFNLPRGEGGLGCADCHVPPSFAISDDIIGHNGVIGEALDPGAQDKTNTRAPSLRDLVAPFMHDGSLEDLEAVVDHYASVDYSDGIDPRLAFPAAVTQADKAALVSFLKALTGKSMYQEGPWSDPFLR
jgi:cytochrome c peroxidase